MEQQQDTALLVMDMQTVMLGFIPGAEAVIAANAKAIAHARSHNIPGIYVARGFRPGAPEISASNKGFMANKNMFVDANMEEFSNIHPDLSPAGNDITVIKRRVSAFSGSDLEMVLRAQNIRHLVLTGIATGGVVLSTLREAADKDYHITVLADACADRDEEIQQVLISKIFPRQAEVLTVKEWMEIK